MSNARRVPGRQPINAYGLKWRGQKDGQHLRVRCEEPPPPAPETWQAKSGCKLPAYHKGLHRSHKFMWATGERGVRKRWDRKK